jgi:hypothetical protein
MVKNFICHLLFVGSKPAEVLFSCANASSVRETQKIIEAAFSFDEGSLFIRSGCVAH